MKRIRVTTNCVADRYVDKRDERIVEFFDPVTQLGGLISLRRAGDKLDVYVYREDEGVHVHAKAVKP